ncbi:MAG: riboflavin synthase [Burkholderiaceae bacterium]
MFTGIITGVGRIVAVHAISAISSLETSTDSSFGKRLTISTPAAYLDDVGLGDSIAINGACMTVTSFDIAANQFTIDISAESLLKTAGLNELGTVNLEKALRAQDRLGGHIVSGHVDGVGHISFFEPVGESWELRITCPPELGKFMAYKGSITVNGVSLTVNRVVDSTLNGKLSTELSINLIPHTIENTALGSLKAGSGVGSMVNLEIDTVARYVERMLSFEKLASQTL